MQASFVLGIVLTLFTCSLGEEFNQTETQKRNVGEQSLPPFNYHFNLRQTTVNRESQPVAPQLSHLYPVNNVAHQHHETYQQQQQQQQHSDWEVQKAHAQAQWFHGSDQQYQQVQQPWIPQPDYIQHNHINQQQQQQQQVQPFNQHQNIQQYPQQQPINTDYIVKQQIPLHHQPQFYQSVVTQYQRPSVHHVVAHRLVYPVPVPMRPPPMPVSMKIPPSAAVAVPKAIPNYMGKHIVFHVFKPVASPVDKPFPVYMDRVQSGKPMPVQVIIRDDDNHKKKPFWG